MIIPDKHRILIVSDFGTGADNGYMTALKEAIETTDKARVIVADLRKMVIDEHPGEELREAEVIELATRKLESLAADRNLSCGAYVDDGPCAPLHEFVLADEDEEYAEETSLPKAADYIVLPRIIRRHLGNCRTLTIHVSRGVDEVTGAPHAIVAFGRSAMLVDGISKGNVLMVNPEYDNDWPWKKQFYAGRKASWEYSYEDNPFQEDIKTAYSFGSVGRGRYRQPERYAVFTSEEKASTDHDLSDRYQRLWMIDNSLDSNTDKLARLICGFAAGEMDIPLLEIDRIVNDIAWMRKWNCICNFTESVKIRDLTATGLTQGVQMANGQSGIRVAVKELDYTLPIEGFRCYDDIAALRDAVDAAEKKENGTPRIMIVPDYFTPHDNTVVLELRKQLIDRGYRVTVFCAGNTLKASRQGLERVCKRRRYDLIVTLETGCLLAARIQGSHRIYVNPDWVAWEWMKRMLGEDVEQTHRRGERSGPFFSYRLDGDEIIVARDMGERYNIRRGDKLSAGWFTPDEADSHLPSEHIKRFSCAAYPPMIGLDTETGIGNLAKEIDKLMKSYEN